MISEIRLGFLFNVFSYTVESRKAIFSEARNVQYAMKFPEVAWF